jgi:predicted nucleic acid-binding protein
MGSSPVKIAAALHQVNRLCFDSAPLIYAAEERAAYVERMRLIFRLIRSQSIQVFSASITLTEVLTKPLKEGDTKTITAYQQMMTKSRQFKLISITPAVAEQAAELRARHNLKTPDALQIAVAVSQQCDALLTNDLGLKRVTEVQVLVLDELTV